MYFSIGIYTFLSLFHLQDGKFKIVDKMTLRLAWLQNCFEWLIRVLKGPIKEDPFLSVYLISFRLLNCFYRLNHSIGILNYELH